MFVCCLSLGRSLGLFVSKFRLRSVWNHSWGRLAWDCSWVITLWDVSLEMYRVGPFAWDVSLVWGLPFGTCRVGSRFGSFVWCLPFGIFVWKSLILIWSCGHQGQEVTRECTRKITSELTRESLREIPRGRGTGEATNKSSKSGNKQQIGKIDCLTCATHEYGVLKGTEDGKS